MNIYDCKRLQLQGINNKTAQHGSIGINNNDSLFMYQQICCIVLDIFPASKPDIYSTVEYNICIWRMFSIMTSMFMNNIFTKWPKYCK